MFMVFSGKSSSTSAHCSLHKLDTALSLSPAFTMTSTTSVFMFLSFLLIFLTQYLHVFLYQHLYHQTSYTAALFCLHLRCCYPSAMDFPFIATQSHQSSTSRRLKMNESTRGTLLGSNMAVNVYVCVLCVPS